MADSEPIQEVSLKISETPEAVTDISKLVELETRTPGLGGFVRLLEASNQVRRDIDLGIFDNLPSQQVYDQIWNRFAGDTVESQALAYSEGGGYPVGVLIKSISEGQSRPPGSYGAVRVIESLPPMFFEVPDSIKLQVAELFFDLADRMLNDPTSFIEASIPALFLQTHLDVIHIKPDGNGRTGEDWMLWWQKKLVKNSRETSGQDGAKAFNPDDLFANMGASVSSINENTIRSWYHHGLRYRYDKMGTPPPFLQDKYKGRYMDGRSLMFERIIRMNAFRREVYAVLTRGLGYTGDPINFETYINNHPEQTIDVFRRIYTDYSSLSSPNPTTLFTLLYETGPYKYQQLEPQDVVKPEYLT